MVPGARVRDRLEIILFSFLFKSCGGPVPVRLAITIILSCININRTRRMADPRNLEKQAHLLYSISTLSLTFEGRSSDSPSRVLTPNALGPTGPGQRDGWIWPYLTDRVRRNRHRAAPASAPAHGMRSPSMSLSLDVPEHIIVLPYFPYNNLS